jgi:phage baseplate assembly protein W
MAIKYSTPKFQPSQSKPVGFIPQQLLDQMGKGMALPLVCIENEWQVFGGMQKVEQNMYCTLMTPVGRALMQPDFGSMLPYMIFEVLTPTLTQQMRETVNDALRAWVSEIVVKSVTIDTSLAVQNVTLINIQYVLVDTSQTQTLTLGYASPDTQQYPPGLFVVQNRQLFPS